MLTSVAPIWGGAGTGMLGAAEAAPPEHSSSLDKLLANTVPIDLDDKAPACALFCRIEPLGGTRIYRHRIVGDPSREMDVPILLLTARDDRDDIVLGLDAGADDIPTLEIAQTVGARQMTEQHRH